MAILGHFILDSQRMKNKRTGYSQNLLFKFRLLVLIAFKWCTFIAGFTFSFCRSDIPGDVPVPGDACHGEVLRGGPGEIPGMSLHHCCSYSYYAYRSTLARYLPLRQTLQPWWAPSRGTRTRGRCQPSSLTTSESAVKDKDRTVEISVKTRHEEDTKQFSTSVRLDRHISQICDQIPILTAAIFSHLNK